MRAGGLRAEDVDLSPSVGCASDTRSLDSTIVRPGDKWAIQSLRLAVCRLLYRCMVRGTDMHCHVVRRHGPTNGVPAGGKETMGVRVSEPPKALLK